MATHRQARGHGARSGPDRPKPRKSPAPSARRPRSTRGGRVELPREGEARIVHGVARWIAKYGLMSRSEAERSVAAGRVHVNGKLTMNPDRACHPERDRITVDGKPLRPARRVFLAMHKPAGCITAASDPGNRPTVHDLLPPGTARVQAVGRLDPNASGLLLFTNDPEFAARITDGKGSVEKVYETRVRGRPSRAALRRFETGIDLDGKPTLPARLKVLESDEGSTLVEVTITDGRNRQVRRMWDALGHPVLDLHRTRIGPISLGDLPPGRTRVISEFERATLQVKP
ncbi:MAG TPA: pseudouridine synthase [Planctomycetota bacterium]|nr:pseudouridine synthase [Planctomycetota bacterium]